MTLATARGGGAKAQPAQRAGLGPTSRAPRWGRATTLAILASLLVLAAWTGLRVVSSVVHGQLDGEGSMAALLLNTKWIGPPSL